MYQFVSKRLIYIKFCLLYFLKLSLIISLFLASLANSNHITLLLMLYIQNVFYHYVKELPLSWSWYDKSNSSPKHHLHLVLFINVSLPYRKTPGSSEAGSCVVYFQTVRKRRHLILRGSRQRRQASQNLSTAAFSSERERVWKYTTQPPASHSRESLF